MKKKRILSLMLACLLLLTLVFSSVTSAAESMYTVKPGDYLTKIAREYGIHWRDIANENRLENPDLIHPGQQLKIPGASTPAVGTNETTITLVASADMHGRIYSYEYATDSVDADAGLAKIQTLVKQEKARNANLILMDLGDTVQDNSAELFNSQPVHPMVEAMNYMGYDTWTIGNHEFNFEKAFLEKNIAAFSGTVLGANIYKTDGTRYVKPYTIINRNGVRVAIVGMITPHIPRWEASSPEHFEGLVFKSLVEESKKIVKELAGKYDVLVGAIHEGRDGEYGETGLKAIAEACPEFDVIFGGHEHAKYDNLDINGVKLIEPGAYGWALAKADIQLKKEGNAWKVVDVATKNIETMTVAEDKDMLAQFASVHEKSLADANVVIGKVSEDFVKNVDYITGASTVTTMPTTQLMDTALIDLINEVQMFYAESEVSSAAVFKKDMNLMAGDFKKKNVADIYKYTNTLMGINITGANLKAYMEWSASYYNTAVDGDVTVSFNETIRDYNYDMFAGVKYDIDISKPAGSRIANATINGNPIDDAATYKLAVNNYRFGTLTSLKLVTDADVYYDSYKLFQDAGRIRDLIGRYVQEEKAGVVSPSVDNNWKIIGFNFNHPLKDVIFDMIKKGEIQIPVSDDGRTPNVKAVNAYTLMKEGKFKSIDILSFNDFHGNVAEASSATGNPGMAKLVTAAKNAVAANPNTIIVSAGDNYQGTAISNLTYGKPVSAMMKEMGVVASAVGNHELDWGAEKIAPWAADGGFDFIASNIYDTATGKPVTWAKPYLMVTRDGVKVAFIGLAHQDTPSLTKAEYTKDLEFRDAVSSAQDWVDFLKSGEAPEGTPDYIIALTHLDSAQDPTTKEITGSAADLARKVTGLSGVISAHSHNLVSGKVNSIPVVQGYYNGRTMAQISIVLDADGKLLSLSSGLNNLYLTKSNIIPDTTSVTIYDTYQTELAPVLKEKLGTASAEFTHDRNTKGSVSTLGKWVCDVMMAKTGVQVAIQNGGGLRRTLAKGDITMGDLYEIMPFDNTLVTLELSGADLKKAIDHGINNPSITDGQFSGLKVVYDAEAEFENRIKTITLADGTALRDDAYYTVVINDFMLTGGDKYDFSNARNVKNTYVPIRDVLVDAIRDAKTITPPTIDFITPIAMEILEFIRAA